MTRAVVFDLWDTLAVWPQEDMTPVFAAAGLSSEEWASRPHVDKRWTGSLGAYLDWIGLDAEASAVATELRHDLTRRALVPVDGALETLAEMRSRGLGSGLISNCSGDVCDLWEQSPFGDAFDVVVLSAAAGLCKPDERIYRLALEQLGVEAGEVVFVGDGANDELAGAERVGMRAVQIGSGHPWSGERIATIPEVLALV